MKHSRTPINRQNGSSIMMAIFVLIIVGLLGSAMVSLLNQSEEGVAREVVSMRALMAAESGAERGLQQALGGGSCPGGGVALLPMLSWSFAGSTGLQGCTAAVSCAVQTIDGVNYYTIKSRGECGPSNSRAHRIIQLQAQDI